MNDLILAQNRKINSLEIAEMAEKSHRHVMRDIRKMEESWVKLGRPKFGLTYYTDKSNREQQMYSLSKTECLYIATKYDDEMRGKLIIRWEQLETKPLTGGEILLQQAQIQLANERRFNQHENRILELEAKTTISPDYYAIAGYAAIVGKKVDRRTAAKLGKKAAKICRDNDYEIGKTNHPSFGWVNTYPKEVLKQVFNQNK